MKKYFVFLLSIIAAEYVVAQQTERPLFRDFMNNRNEFSNLSIEKIIVDPERGFSIPENYREVQVPHAMARFSHVLPNGNKVYILPLDNMPCVVPDMSAFNMPVAGGGLDTDKAIHATPPQRIIPSPDNILLPQQQTSGKK